MSAFTIGGIALPVPKQGGLEEAPDGQGKSRWTLTIANVEEATLASVRALIGIPSGAESVRAWDGTLLTDRALVACAGDLLGGTIMCEVTETTAPYRPHILGTTSVFSRRATFTLREG